MWPADSNWKSKKVLIEIKPAVILTVPSLQDITEDFSNYNRLKCVDTWCLHYILDCRSSLKAKLHSSKLSLNELKIAENRLIKLCQEHSFKAELKNGLIRDGGRIEKSALSEALLFYIIQITWLS